MKSETGKAASHDVVGMGEVHFAAEGCEFNCIGVGSGIVVAAYDPSSKIGACAHFILPQAPESFDVQRPAKYVNTGFAEVVRQMTTMGADPHRIRVALAGASSLIPSGDSADHLDLGARNLRAALQALEEKGFPCVAQDVGGQAGRTVSLSTVDGVVRVRTGVQPDKRLCELRG